MWFCDEAICEPSLGLALVYALSVFLATLAAPLDSSADVAQLSSEQQTSNRPSCQYR